MRKFLRNTLLLAGGCVCIVLLCMGTMVAIGLALTDVFIFSVGLAEKSRDMAGMLLFGLVTVSLTSASCFPALLSLAETCIDALQPGITATDHRKVLTSALAVAVTMEQWLSVHGDWFIPVCAAADVLHLVLLLDRIRQRRKRV